LDSGIDSTHPDFKGEDRIKWKEAKTWIGGDPNVDTCGHGTHVAGIILELTKSVDLYIGKITETRMCKDKEQIAKVMRRQPSPPTPWLALTTTKAINHARTQWGVDMISLSFGFNEPVTGILKEIDDCINAGIIVFAAASNDGGNLSRTYPARWDRVFCIHSATGEGNKASFNPSPIDKEYNFSVVGDCINSTWPSNSLNKAGGKKYMSGTSFATPVAVSIAAFMIAYIQKKKPDQIWKINPKSPKGVKAIFQLMADERDKYDWISPQRYFKAYREAKILADIDHALNG